MQNQSRKDVLAGMHPPHRATPSTPTATVSLPDGGTLCETGVFAFNEPALSRPAPQWRALRQGSVYLLRGGAPFNAVPRVVPIEQDQSSEEACLQLDSELESMLAEPVEAGVRHPAETVLGRLLDCDNGCERVQKRLYRPSSGRSDLVMCLGRSRRPADIPAIVDGVIALLESRRLDERTVAVRALEAWHTDKALLALRIHREPDGWLAGYIARVLG